MNLANAMDEDLVAIRLPAARQAGPLRGHAERQLLPEINNPQSANPQFLPCLAAAAVVYVSYVKRLPVVI